MRRLVAAVAALLLPWCMCAPEGGGVTVEATLNDAIYSWWVHPLAVHDGDRTWVGSLGGWPDGGHDRIWRVSGSQVDSVELDGSTGPDEHNAPAIAFNDEQQDLIAFYARHNNDDFTRYQTVDRDSLALGSLQTLDFGGRVTYNQVLHPPGTDTIHLIVRNADANEWQYKTSTDWGSSWGSTKTLLQFSGFGSTYVIARPDPLNPSRVWMGVGPHPPNGTHTETHFAQISLASGEITATDGTALGDLDDVSGPQLDPDDLEIVIDPGSSRTRLLDIGTVDGRPALAYGIWPDDDTEATYRVRRFNGTSWADLDFEISSGPEFGYLRNRRYIGGMALGRDSDLYTSRRNSGGEWIVEHWAYSDGDLALDQELDRSTIRLIRPYVPLGAGPTDVVYQRVLEYSETGTGGAGDLLLATLDEVAPPEVPQDEGLPQVAQAVIRTRLTWLSCNLSDGAVITELPDLQGDEVSRVIGEYTSANLSLPIPAVGGRDLTLAQRAALAIQSTEPARTMIVPVVNDVPTAGFIPLTRDLGTGANVMLGCVSLEGYLRHRYVRDHNWEGVDPAEIARGVLADAEDIDGNGQGINLTVDAPDVGLNAARHFEAIDDVDVYSALAELMDAGLIEWTVDVDWASGMAYRVVEKIARVRLRLGRSGDPTAVFESATFSSQGASDARYTLKGEHSGDRYGNSVIARGTGEGEDKPRSAVATDQAALDAGAPIWEQRIDPEIYRSPLFTEAEFNAYMQEQLGVHATEELARIRGGGQSLEITARWDAPGARYGVDWLLGDSVQHELVGHAHPDGFNGVRRAIGFALSIQRGTIRPILQEET